MEPSTKTITLADMHGTEYTVTVAEGSRSSLVRDIVEDDPISAGNIPFPDVDTREMERIVEFMRRDVLEPFVCLERPIKGIKHITFFV